MTASAATARNGAAPEASGGPSTILLVPFADGIGDFVNMLPIIDAVRRRYPQARLTVAASQHVRHLLPDDAVAVVTPSWLRRKTSLSLIRIRWLISQRLVATASTLGLRRELGRFDVTINLFKSWEHGMAFARDWTPRVPARPGAVHTLDYLAVALAAWDVPLPIERRSPRLIVRQSARSWAHDAWDRLAIADRPVVGLVPASNMAIKQWPADAWVRVNGALRERGGRTVVFLPTADHPARFLADLGRESAAPLVGDLAQVAGALERCDLVVSVDTGLLHMAAAVGTPYIGLFGPTNPDVTGPYDRSIGRCLVAPFAKGGHCSGCWKNFKYEDDRCRALRDGSCMSALDWRPVFAAAEAVMARRRGVRPAVSL